MIDGYGDEQATLGDRIAAGREAVGYSLEDLAMRLGVTPEKLAEWEHDQSAPRASRLQMLAGLLNVTLVWLMAGDADGPEDEDRTANDIASLAQALRQLQTDQLRLAERAGRLERKLRALIDE